MREFEKIVRLPVFEEIMRSYQENFERTYANLEKNYEIILIRLRNVSVNIFTKILRET